MTTKLVHQCSAGKTSPMKTIYRKFPVLFSCCAHLLCACASSPVINSDLHESVQWYTGAAGRVDDARARRHLEAAIAGGDTLAIMWEARVYSTGRMGFERDPQRAAEIAASVVSQVQRLADAGNVEAMFLMGTAFAEGLGRSVDAQTAALWYERAASEGHMLAQHNLGNVYASGTGVEKSELQAVSWWRRAALSGDAIPQYRLGQAYEAGSGTAPDRDEAIRWYRDAASRGNDAAQQALERLAVESLPDE